MGNPLFVYWIRGDLDRHVFGMGAEEKKGMVYIA